MYVGSRLLSTITGNMTRGRASGGVIQRYEYDEAGRLVKVKADNGTLLEEYGYGRNRERIKKTKQDGSKVYYAWGGSSVLAEYEEGASATVLSWTKSYVYAGSRLLSTITKTGSTETTEYHHPDRLGTKLITNPAANTAKEQGTLPYGTSLDAETTTPQANNGVGPSNQRFTSYDRSGTTGLDYAVNRIYSSEQGRFTQPDPIGMASVDLTDPQTLNLYTYARNNPVDFTDPMGLMPVGPGYCIRYHYTNLSGTIQFWGPWTCYGGSGGGYDEPDSFGFAGGGDPSPEPKQDEKRCIVKNMGNMSQELQNKMSGLGIRKTEFSGLRNKAKLGFLNVLGAMADKELSLMGWNVDRKWRGSRLKIDQERTYFTPKNPKSSVYDNLKAAVSKSNFKQQNLFKHKNVDTSFRQNVSKNSMQIGFGNEKGKPFMEIDIDPNNPHKRPGAHLVDYFFRSPTDPYRVANRRYWECKPQKGGGKK